MASTLCEGGRIVQMAVMVAVTVNTDGRREILGITVMPSETATFRADLLRSLICDDRAAATMVDAP